MPCSNIVRGRWGSRDGGFARLCRERVVYRCAYAAMDKMIAEMTDSGAKQQATMHLNMSKAEMKNGNEVGCLAHMQEAHKVRWACSLGLALNAGCGKAMPTRAQARSSLARQPRVGPGSCSIKASGSAKLHQQ